MAKSREVAGQLYSYNDFIELIIKTMDDLGQGRDDEACTCQEIATAWADPYWLSPEGKLELANFLLQKSRNGSRVIFTKVSYGRYKVANRVKVFGRTAHEQAEKQIVPMMIENGGFIHYRTIRQSYGFEPRAGTLMPVRNMKPGGGAERRRAQTVASFNAKGATGYDDGVRRAIMQSEIIRKDIRRQGLYNLPYAMIAAIPLEARWAEMMLFSGLKLANAQTKRRWHKTWGNAEQRDARKDFLFSVGDAYRRVREVQELEYADLMEDDAVAAVIREVGAHRDLAPFRRAFEESLLPHDDPTTATRAPPPEYKVGTRPEDWPHVVMAMFENGKRHAHIPALTRFHRVLSAFYKMDPVWMSRGLIVPVPVLS